MTEPKKSLLTPEYMRGRQDALREMQRLCVAHGGIYCADTNTILSSEELEARIAALDAEDAAEPIPKMPVWADLLLVTWRKRAADLRAGAAKCASKEAGHVFDAAAGQADLCASELEQIALGLKP